MKAMVGYQLTEGSVFRDDRAGEYSRHSIGKVVYMQVHLTQPNTIKSGPRTQIFPVDLPFFTQPLTKMIPCKSVTLIHRNALLSVPRAYVRLGFVPSAQFRSWWPSVSLGSWRLTLLIISPCPSLEIGVIDSCAPHVWSCLHSGIIPDLHPGQRPG